MQLLRDVGRNRPGAEEELLPLVYEDLRRLAHRAMRGERPGHTLQTTALVHEAYMRLRGAASESWESRAHFLRVAARAMRRVLIDHARRKLSDKRGGGVEREPLDAITLAHDESPGDLLALNDALDRLAAVDARMAQVVELRFFAGLTLEDTARVLGVSRSTVKNDWTMARAWLKQQGA